MGKARLIADTFITSAALLTASSIATGRVTAAQKEGIGVASMVVQGDYTGTVLREYLVEIDAGGEIGVATFRWSDDAGDTFAASGIVTATTPIVLSYGLSVLFGGSSGTDCVIGDRWVFRAFLVYGPERALDRDRDTEWRSADVAGWITLDLDFGTAKTPTVLVLADHNFSGSAEVRLHAADVANYAVLQVDDPVTVSSSEILAHYIGAPARTHRYWRVAMRDLANPDGYLRLSEVFLGTYVELSRGFELGDVRRRVRLPERQRLTSGRWTGGLNTVLTEFSIEWRRLTPEDRDRLLGVFDVLHNETTRRTVPLFFHPDTDATDLVAVEWTGGSHAESEPDAPGRYTVPLELVEVRRTA